MVLDAFSTVFMWVGLKANKVEKAKTIKKVEQYIANIQDGRDKDKVQVIIVEPLSEPINFTTHFPEWEDEVSEKWLELDPYEAAMKRIEEERKANAAKLLKKQEVKYDVSSFFSIDELRKGCPNGVNPASKEQHLSDDDFKTIFGMEKAAFNELKDWKRKDLKKKHGLF